METGLTSIPQVPSSDPTGETPDVSVVIVNYNVREFLEQALRSVENASRTLRVETWVVDNNSVDGSVAMVREHFPAVRLIANERNEGFGSANNQALRQARGRYVLILNPDTILQEDTLETLVRFMEAHPGAGAVGCKIMNPDGTFAAESRRSFPTPEVAFFRMTGLARLFPRSRVFGRYNMTYLPPDQAAEVDALSGSCMFVRRSALMASGEPGRHEPAGLFDEAFFMYGEDLDLCFRIQQKGWQVWYTPDTQIIHYKGESTKKGEFRYVRLFYGAMVLFTRKHLRSRYSAAFASLLQVAIVLRAAVSVLAEGIRRAAAPLADFGLVYGVVTLLGWWRAAEAGTTLVPLFFLSVAPAYGLGTVAGITLAGGYRRSAPARVRPALLGILASFLFVGTVSYFVRTIAFSRVVVLTSLPVGAVLLVAWRLAWKARQSEARRAVLVGEAAEALRLQAMLGGHPRPPFRLEGHVEAGDDPGSGTDGFPRPLGQVRHLRDLIRLRRIRDVVFATKNLENRDIFSIMQSLRDLPVEFRMLGEGRSHVIGKARVAELAVPDLHSVISRTVHVRGSLGRRAFELPIAVAGLAAWPLVAAAGLLTGPTSRTARAARRLGLLPGVVTGRRFLVGTAPDHASLVPAGWRLKEGVFNIADMLHGHQPAEGDLVRAYGFYVTHQSAALDWEIIHRTLVDTQRPT